MLPPRGRPVRELTGRPASRLELELAMFLLPSPCTAVKSEIPGTLPSGVMNPGNTGATCPWLIPV